jgi:hypothetical protein
MKLKLVVSNDLYLKNQKRADLRLVVDNGPVVLKDRNKNTSVNINLSKFAYPPYYSDSDYGPDNSLHYLTLFFMACAIICYLFGDLYKIMGVFFGLISLPFIYYSCRELFGRRNPYVADNSKSA